jgi:hypothetical protein
MHNPYAVFQLKGIFIFKQVVYYHVDSSSNEKQKTGTYFYFYYDTG